MIDFKDEWNIWIFQKKNKWKKSNLEKIFTIRNSNDFIQFDNNLRNDTSLLSKHIFIMKNNIIPLWEEKENIHGGCWTFKSSIYDSLNHFLHILIIMITNNFLTDEYNSYINGLSFCQKNENICILQVWNSNYEKLKNINHHYYIRETYKYNIIYKKHLTN